MREIDFLHYHPGRGFWHRHDPRMKLFEISAWSVIALSAGPWALAAVGAVLLVLHTLAGTRLRRMLKPLLFWGIMASAIVVTAGLTDTGRPLIVAGKTLPLGLEGLADGALRAARLLTVLLAGQLLAATTDPGDLSGALRKLTAFLPASWSSGLATSVSLTLSFIPLILDESALIRDAAFSRGLGIRRSIFRRAVSLGLPMAEATLRRADITSEALLSRCINEKPTPPALRITFTDLLVTTLVTGIPLLITALQ